MIQLYVTGFCHFPFQTVLFGSENINVMSKIIQQQILGSKLLLIVIDEQKSDFSGGLRFKPVTTYRIEFIVIKLL